ncbi:MAG: polymorphic toxin-type HINT domain-containing protein [Pseudomonadota bacterium]
MLNARTKLIKVAQAARLQLNRLSNPIGVAALGLLFSGIVPNADAQQTASTAIPTFKVSASGAASYSLNLRSAPGTRSIQPDLSLAYSSQSGNGQVGMGWNLGGFSQIERCGANFATNGFSSGVSYSSTDRFCLDGSRLMNVEGSDKSDTYFQDGSVYHTQLESWRKVEAFASNEDGSTCGDSACRFSITLKNGTKLEYGYTSDSQFLAQDPPGQTKFASGSDLNGAVRSWALNKVTDRNNNYITFQYTDSPQTDGGTVVADANGVGAHYISRIDYTANDEATPAMVAQRSVQFFYETRPDISTTYQGGARITTGARLSSIVSCIDSSDITSETCSSSSTYQVATYKLTYCDQDTGCSDNFVSRTGRSVLYTVQECGTDSSTCLPTNVFEWQTGTNTVDNVNGSSSDLGTTQAQCSSSSLLNWADFNGDGLPDWICNDAYGSGGVNVLLASVGNQATLVPPAGAPGNGQLNNVTARCDGGQVQWSDFTASGDVDWLCYDDQGYFYVLESDGSTLAPTAAGDPAGSGSPGRLKGINNSPNYVQAICPETTEVTWADFNGDGFTDWICTTGSNGAYSAYVLISNGNTLSTLAGTTPTSLSEITPLNFSATCESTAIRTWLDFNADGLADFTCSNPATGSVSVFLSTGSSIVSISTTEQSGIITSQALCAGNEPLIEWPDVNGDDLPDWTCTSTELFSISVMVSTGSNLVNFNPDAGSPSSAYSTNLGCGGDTSAEPGWSDFNGDGLADMICYSENGAAIYFQLSSGTGLQSAPASPISNAASCQSGIAQWMDFNGDQLVDWVCAIPSFGTVSVLVGAPSYPDMINSLTNGLGGRIDVSYSPLADKSVYSQTDTPAYPGGKVLGFSNLYILDQVPLYVVSDYTISSDATRNTSGNGYSYEYALHYTNGRVGLLGLGWQGFETMTVYDMPAGNNLTIGFLQGFPFTGKVSTAIACTASSASQICESSENGGSPLYSVDQAYLCESDGTVDPNVDCSTDPRYQPLGSDLGVYQILMVERSATHASFGYELVNGFDYDEYGNQIFQAQLGDTTSPDSKPLYTCASFSNSQSPWLIGFQTNKKQSSASTCPDAVSGWANYQYDTDTDLNWQQTAYDQNQNVLSVINWDQPNNGWIGKVFGRDTAGLGNVTSIALTNSAGASPSAVPDTTYTLGYDENYNSFLSSVVTPPANSADPSSTLTSSFATDARFGARVGSSDPNGNISLSCINSFGQTTLVQAPLASGYSSGEDTNCLNAQSAFYGDTGVSTDFTNATVTTLSDVQWINENSTVYSKTTTRTDWASDFSDAKSQWVQRFVDGLGRPYRRIAEGMTDNNAMDIEYLTRKKVHRVSVPYVAGQSPDDWFTVSYDSYGRKEKLVIPYTGRDASAQQGSNPCSSDPVATTNAICWSYSSPNTITLTGAANTSTPETASTQFLFFGGQRMKVNLTNQGGTASTSYDFDPLGRPVSVVDPLGATITIVRDSLGRVITTTDTSNGTSTNSYNTLGQLFQSINATGGSSTFTYDGLSRVLSQTVANRDNDTVETIDYTYDTIADAIESGVNYNNLKGQLSGTSVTQQNDSNRNSFYAFGYDNLGQRNTATLTFQDQVSTFTGSISPVGAPISVNYPDSAGTSVSYQYTDVGWPSEVNVATSAQPDGTDLATYEDYVLTGQPQTVNYGSGLVESFAFSNIGTLQQHAITGPNSATPDLAANSYVWNHLGRVVQIADCLASANSASNLCANYPSGTSVQTDDGTADYAYENRRLTSASNNQYGDLAYRYSTNGNISSFTDNGTTTTFAYNEVGDAETYQLVTGTDGFRAKYDDRGNMVGKISPSGDQWIFVFDSRNRLIEAIKNKLTVETYIYDANGQRLQKNSYAADGKTVASTVNYSGKLFSTTSDSESGDAIETVNLIGPAGFSAAYSGSDSNIDEYNLHRNPLTQSTQIVTDSSDGSVLSTIDYKPYGLTQSILPANSGFYRAKFQSHELDDATGLYYFGARYYDPEIRRFISADDQLGAGPYHQDAFNRYEMVLGNPVSNWDPDGHAGYCGLAGGVVGGVITLGGAAGGLGFGIAYAAADGQNGWDRTEKIAGNTAIGAGIGGVAGAIVGGSLTYGCNQYMRRGETLDSLRTQRDANLDQLNGTRQDLINTRGELEQKNQDLDRVTGQRNEAHDDLADTQRDLVQSEQNLQASNADNADLQQQVQDLTNQRNQLQQQIDQHNLACPLNAAQQSFAAPTRISTKYGHKEISEIRVGDLVAGFDEETGRIGYFPVTRLYERTAPGVLHITINGEVIETTAEHPFMVEGRGWIKAKHLKAGDLLKSLNGEQVSVEKITAHPGAIKVHNFTVSTAHSYYAAGPEVLVHNGEDECDPSDLLDSDTGADADAASNIGGTDTAAGEAAESGEVMDGAVEAGADVASGVAEAGADAAVAGAGISFEDVIIGVILVPLAL